MKEYTYSQLERFVQRKAVYYQHGFLSTGHKYAVLFGAKYFTSNETDDLLLQLCKELGIEPYKKRKPRQCGYINTAKVKKLCKTHGKQASKKLIHDLNCMVDYALLVALTTWNGSGKRLSSELLPKDAKRLAGITIVNKKDRG